MSLFKEIKKTFIEEFSSVKLAIVLFAFIALATLIGTILPEEPMVGTQKLVEKYGEKNYLTLKMLGFTDVFHSWWYLALLTTMGLNLITASFVKVFPRAKKAFLWPMEIRMEAIPRLPVSSEISLSDKNNLDHLKKILEKKRYKTKFSKDLLLAVKGGWHRLGASVTHVGILTLLIGSAFSILTGFNGMVQLSKNEGFYVTDLGQSSTQIKSVEENNWLAPASKMPIWFGSFPGYLIKVNETWREDYPTGQPKQWFSDLSVFDENKKELYRKVIHVNDPLQFMGLDVYQSNWGRFAEITFNQKQTTIPLENVNGEELIILPLSDEIALKLKTKNKSKGDLNLQDILEVFSILVKENKASEKFLGEIHKNQELKIGPINIGYLGSQTLTGLQFKSNPGDLLIYPGMFFIILGVFIAFGAKKQIWATVDQKNNKILVGGSSDRSKNEFNNEFEKIIIEFSGVKK